MWGDTLKIVYQLIKWMLDSFFFVARVRVFINMDRKTSNGLGKNPDAGIDSSHLHGASFVDGFARIASTKEKTVGTAIGTVGRLVSGVKNP